MESVGEYRAEDIKDKINNVRSQLNVLVDRKTENIISPDVINLSWELDKLIVEYLKAINH